MGREVRQGFDNNRRNRKLFIIGLIIVVLAFAAVYAVNNLEDIYKMIVEGTAQYN